MVWVHWNEKSWIDALDEIINDLVIVKWKVYFIYANTKAIEKNVRFIEKNLNRCFIKNISSDTYEGERAIELMNIFDKSDYLLDIHNTESLNSSLEVLITTNTNYSKYFEFDKVVTNIDDISKWGSDWYMDSIWKKWFCIECWSLYSWEKFRWKYIAKNSIINFLKVLWNIYGEPIIYNKKIQIIKMYYLYLTKTIDFKLYKNFSDFDEIKLWEIIAYDWWKEIKCDKDSIIIFSHNRNKIWEEWFYLGYKL